MKLPLIKDITGLIVALKPEIGNEYRADPEDTFPGMLLTVGCNPETGEWSYQTGDNSFSGSAYFYPIWGVVSIYRRSNAHDLAVDIREQIAEQYHATLETA